MHGGLSHCKYSLCVCVVYESYKHLLMVADLHMNSMLFFAIANLLCFCLLHFFFARGLHRYFGIIDQWLKEKNNIVMVTSSIIRTIVLRLLFLRRLHLVLFFYFFRFRHFSYSATTVVLTRHWLAGLSVSISVENWMWWAVRVWVCHTKASTQRQSSSKIY